MADKLETTKRELATRAGTGMKPSQTIKEMIMRYQKQIEMALPKQIGIDRFTRIAFTALNAKAELQSCDSMSFMAALLQSAQMGLEPNSPLGQAFLIPYAGKVQFQIGYKGILELAYRTKEYKTIFASKICEHDEFEYEYGTDAFLRHKPAKFGKDRGEAIGYYAYYQLHAGGIGFVVWSKLEIEKHKKKYSKGWDRPGSAWQTNFDSMALKTCLINLMKFAPKSIEFAIALAQDNSIKQDIDAKMEDVPSITMEIDAEGRYSIPDDKQEIKHGDPA